MNFFGHAMTAGWKRHSPALALGAMLPDFAAIAKTAIEGCDHAEIESGIEWHHRTDDAFHNAPQFTELVRMATRSLRARQVRRGPARGAAHVAVELLLDGVFLADDEAVDLYRRAVELGHPTELGGTLTWEANGGERFERLRQRLADEVVPTAYRDPDQVTRRTTRALSGRPLLALSDSERISLRGTVGELTPEVAAAAPHLVEFLRRELGVP